MLDKEDDKMTRTASFVKIRLGGIGAQLNAFINQYGGYFSKNGNEIYVGEQIKFYKGLYLIEVCHFINRQWIYCDKSDNLYLSALDKTVPLNMKFNDLLRNISK